MQLLNPDGSSFHGTGIIPDIEVVPTAEEFARGDDPELKAALEFLGR
jgi:C-terminal processing protease CtpA/Prc